MKTKLIDENIPKHDKIINNMHRIHQVHLENEKLQRHALHLDQITGSVSIPVKNKVVDPTVVDFNFEKERILQEELRDDDFQI